VTLKLFHTPEIAKGYADSRPYFHPLVIGRIKSYLDLSKKLNIALDVGCGAGLSTIALLEIAERVIGVDPSEPMISSAIMKEGIEYFNYPAEHLPFNQKFDLITLSGSINWIDRDKFFSEAKRIISNECFVIIYDNNFLGIIEEDDRFKQWYQHEYLAKFPKPYRDESPFTQKEAAKHEFEFVKSENYSNNVNFKLSDFINYLFTQSNITSILDRKPDQAENINKWLTSSLGSLFRSQEKTFKFGGNIWYLKRL
jgi:SAM-dependent methyltransferase